MEKTVELLFQVSGLFLISWYLVCLKPLQVIVEHLSERSGIFNNFVAPLLSCMWCSSFWSVLIGLSFDLKLYKPLYIALVVSFIVRTLIKIYENRRPI